MSGLIPFNRRNQSIFDTSMNSFQNMLDDFFNDTWAPARNLARDTFKLDICETESEYAIIAELPGYTKEDVGLDLSDGKLTISVNKNEEVNRDGEKNSYIHRERRMTSMSRSIYLADIEPDGIKAKLENGILTVTVPKQAEKSNSCKISID